MATRRKPHPKSPRGDAATYASFMRAYLSGTIEATALLDVTEPDGTREVTQKQFDEGGVPLPDRVVTVPKTRLVSVQYDEPARPGRSR